MCRDLYDLEFPKIDSNEYGVVLMNGAESPLVSEVKEKQDQDLILLKLKGKCS